MNLYDRQQTRTMRNFDLILCRNVLIYFDTKSKIQVVADLYNSLNYGGYSAYWVFGTPAWDFNGLQSEKSRENNGVQEGVRES